MVEYDLNIAETMQSPAGKMRRALTTNGGTAAIGGAKPYPLKTCIVTDNDIDSMGDQQSIVHEGQVVKFCCEPCVRSSKRTRRNFSRSCGSLAAAKQRLCDRGATRASIAGGIFSSEARPSAVAVTNRRSPIL